MKILVTGGAGYIGSAAAEALLSAGHEVTVYDSLVTGYREAVPSGARFIQADLADSAVLAKSFNETKFDAVMHFAAFIEAGESMKDPAKFLKNNLINSLLLIETAVKAGVNRFVLSSTAAVYQTQRRTAERRVPAWADQRLRIHQARHRAIVGLVPQNPRTAIRGAALLQRMRRASGARRSAPARVASNSARVTGGAGTGRDTHLWHGLPHPRRHLHSRLHPHRGPGLRAPAGASTRSTGGTGWSTTSATEMATPCRK